MSQKRNISRRDFNRGAALMATAAVVLPTELLAQSNKAATPLKPPEKPQQNPPASTAPEQELSDAARAEADRNFQTLLQEYGTRFSDEQKKDIQRLLLQQQKAIEAVRAFALENGDEPATVLRLYFSEEAAHASTK